MSKKVLTSLAIIVILHLVLALPLLADTPVKMQWTGTDPLGCKNVSNSWVRLGQRLPIPDRIVTEIGYYVWRVGAPTGNVSFSIYDAETDEVIVSRVWGDAGDLPEVGINEYQSILLDSPIKVDGDVRLCVEFYGGNSTDYCVAGYYSGNKIVGEYYTNYYYYGQWHDIEEAEEGSYYYAYVVGDSTGNFIASSHKVLIVLTILAAVAILTLAVRRFIVRRS